MNEGDAEDAGSEDALVRLYHVSKSYLPGVFALRDVNLKIGKGELVFVTGPSGAGKTTLLKLLFAAERPSEGQIVIGGRNVGRLRESAIPLLRRVTTIDEAHDAVHGGGVPTPVAKA